MLINYYLFQCEAVERVFELKQLLYLVIQLSALLKVNKLKCSCCQDNLYKTLKKIEIKSQNYYFFYNVNSFLSFFLFSNLNMKVQCYFATSLNEICLLNTLSCIFY